MYKIRNVNEEKVKLSVSCHLLFVGFNLVRDKQQNKVENSPYLSDLYEFRSRRGNNIKVVGCNQANPVKYIFTRSCLGKCTQSKSNNLYLVLY